MNEIYATLERAIQRAENGAYDAAMAWALIALVRVVIWHWIRGGEA